MDRVDGILPVRLFFLVAHTAIYEIEISVLKLGLLRDSKEILSSTGTKTAGRVSTPTHSTSLEVYKFCWPQLDRQPGIASGFRLSLLPVRNVKIPNRPLLCSGPKKKIENLENSWSTRFTHAHTFLQPVSKMELRHAAARCYSAMTWCWRKFSKTYLVQT
jgi:hypothetical protein